MRARLALTACLLATPSLAGTVTGRVELLEKGGKPASDLSDVVVYLEGVKVKPEPAIIVQAGGTPMLIVIGIGSLWYQWVATMSMCEPGEIWKLE